MTRALLVVHLVSRGVSGERSGWHTADGAVRHEVVSWRQSPTTLSRADIVVAHGLAPLVVAQAIANSGPKLVYRPFNANRGTRRRLRRGLRADWVAAPTRRIGRATAAALGLERARVTVFRNDERAAWDALIASLMLYDGPEEERVEAPTDAAPTASPVVVPAPRILPEGGTSRDVPRPPAPVPGPVNRPRPKPGAGADAAPAMLPVGVVDPTSPGHPWWTYRRMDLPPSATAMPMARPAPGNRANGAASNGASSNGASSNGASSNGSGSGGVAVGAAGSVADGGARPVQIVGAAARSGVGFFALGAVILVVVAVCTQLGRIGEGPYLVPFAGLFLTVAAVRRIVRRRPDEEWVGRWLILGLIAKLLAAYLNYYTVIVTYNGKGDALDYDNVGRQYAQAWLKGGKAPDLSNLKATNFVRWFTGVVYYVFGSKLLTGTFVFALLAFAGSYLWYRATVDAVPIVNRQLYLGFVLFAPSILFWPAIVGKEALMQFALGVLAFGVSLVLRQRLVPGLIVSGASGWLVWVVRPHLLALVAIAAGAAYLAGRVRKSGKKRAGLLGRPIGIIIIALLVSFTIGQGAQFLGIKSLSFNSIQQELDTESKTTSNGNSSFHKSGHSLSPVNWPSDAVTVFLRPFPWEIQSSLQILASMESALLALLIVVRFKSLRLAFTRSRESPFLMFCWVLTGLYAIAFSSFSNFGLLVRERSLVLPAVLVLLSVDPVLDQIRHGADTDRDEPDRAPAIVGADTS